MKVLRLNAYYQPEKTTSIHFFKDMNDAFEQNHIECTIITPMPTRGIDDNTRKQYYRKRIEKENHDFVTVKRIPLMREESNPIQRAIRYAIMNVKTYFSAIKERDVSVVYCSSTPPTQAVVGSLVAKKLSKKGKHHIPFIYNLQDVFPDSLVSAGFTKKGSIIWKIGRKIEDYTYNRADRIIVISSKFKENLLSKGVPEEKIAVVSNWINLNLVNPIERSNNNLIAELKLNPNQFIVVYAGNFGAAQGADIILKAAKQLAENRDIQFVIFGGGSGYQEAVKMAEGMNNVQIHELLPVNRVSEVYSLGDLALITCKPGFGEASMPSKTWSIMACNTPILASFDQHSDLANVLAESGAGICVEPGNVDQLVSAILNESKEKRKRSSVNLREYVNAHASKDVCTQQYIDIFLSHGKQITT